MLQDDRRRNGADDDAPAESVGAVSALFHQAPECRLLTGRDPSDPAVADAHADALIQLFLGQVSEPR